MTDKTLRAKIRTLARRLQIQDFRPGQLETMMHVLKGEDTLAIMPTGAGKSLCYQIPAQLMPGTTIVVSPLISLMKDQHLKIVRMGITGQHLSSELTRKQTAHAMEQLRAGLTNIQFVTPEKLENPEVLKAFRSAGVSLFVVDEAHCISEWGHDFRPAYLGLSKAIEALGHPTVLALTATATPEVTQDVRERLGFQEDSHTIRISYRRDNLVLKARRFRSEADKYRALTRILERVSRMGRMSGIIYCSSVKQTESLVAQLKSSALSISKSVVMYHGRMKKEERRRAQDRFMKRPGTIMVATSAFGMGIDKPDVRFVINYQIPNSVESYYQEVGRAGRDGKRAFGVMFYTQKDKALQRVLSIRKYPTMEHFERAVEVIFAGRSKILQQSELESEIGKKKLNIILKMLEKSGFITMHGRRIRPRRRPRPADVQLMAAAWEERKSDDRARLEDVVSYVNTSLCRWYYLLRYFGEDLEEPCGHCDNCRKQLQQGEFEKLGVGTYVKHQAWGVGEVVERIGPNLRVHFPGIGEKILREQFIQPWLHHTMQDRIAAAKKVA